ncbi:MAG: EscU/YscU/HrcU family type III secretion system export apparatus switch protein [Mariprofundaceae bacterium]|nr:EscU/YscU/HrcU family type III secretion system export apparatus switch protein [Mariprofundaceae bacterium]
MADDQDKSQQTEDASQKRIDDARKKGQVPTSKEPATAIAFLLISSLAVTGLGAWLASHMMNMMVIYLSGAVQLDTTPKGMQHLLMSVTWDLAMMILPVAVPVMLIGMLVAFLVSGPVFTFETLQPKFEKVSPMKGFKRLFSTKSLAEFIKSILKRLPKRELVLLTLYYYEELTMKEVAMVLGLTESRISQLHGQMVVRLRGSLKLDEVK